MRYAVPATGMGNTYDEIASWLEMNVGREHYAINADSLPGATDAISFYFRCSQSSASFAKMMEGKSLDLADPRDGGWERSS